MKNKIALNTKPRLHQTGFNLVELLIVIAVLAFLSAAVGPRIVKMVESRTDHEYIDDMAYYMNISREYITKKSLNSTSTVTLAAMKAYMKQRPDLETGVKSAPEGGNYTISADSNTTRLKFEATGVGSLDRCTRLVDLAKQYAAPGTNPSCSTGKFTLIYQTL